MQSIDFAWTFRLQCSTCSGRYSLCLLNSGAHYSNDNRRWRRRGQSCLGAVEICSDNRSLISIVASTADLRQRLLAYHHRRIHCLPVIADKEKNRQKITKQTLLPIVGQTMCFRSFFTARWWLHSASEQKLHNCCSTSDCTELFSIVDCVHFVCCCADVFISH